MAFFVAELRDGNPIESESQQLFETRAEATAVAASLAAYAAVQVFRLEPLEARGNDEQ